MNDFLDTASACFAEAGSILGQDEFTIGRQKFCGDLNLLEAEKDLMSDGGGFVGTYEATIIAPIGQFTGKFPEPLERSLTGQRLTVKGRDERIIKAAVDAISVTLHLENPNKGK